MTLASVAGELGLLTMLSTADANSEPLVHTNRVLLDTLVSVFEKRA